MPPYITLAYEGLVGYCDDMDEVALHDKRFVMVPFNEISFIGIMKIISNDNIQAPV